MSILSKPRTLLLFALAVEACQSDDRTSFGTDVPEAGPPPTFVEAGTPPVELASDPPPTPVDVIITADNAYSFGWGDETSVNSYYRNAPAQSWQEIFSCPIGLGPEAYTVPSGEALPGAWLYVVSWADYATTQGVIGQFKHRGGDPIYTGSGDWQVCAVGKPYPTNKGGPDQATVNQELAKCNAGTGDPLTTSAGWVGVDGPITPNAVGTVAFGQDNESDVDLRGKPGYVFLPVCKHDVTHDNQGIDGKARWMWYRPPGFTGDPFLATTVNDTRTFLIFRLPTKALPVPVPPK
ncbi:hypothetical protein AKJ09_07153 [Labilithrix luteola]|uniref:Uncharacterized protein n=1 Tax=Labilithrix luteola TaxID=1391654 RepID=A0A0K1Q503_9BACT|nr:hypothetical protein [Labilithrix luteola]AKV00490.1 hypothetical protein AKJ09_07153 [Labilithrix luteola]